MKAKTILYLLFITLVISGCSVNNWDVNRYKRKFEANKEDFEKLVNLLKHENIKVGYSVRRNELSDRVQQILNELDIYDVVLDITQCPNVIEYQFTSSWSRKATLYFSKNICNKEQTVKGFHSTPTEMIEVWGLGDDWTMWIDHDFI